MFLLLQKKDKNKIDKDNSSERGGGGARDNNNNNNNNSSPTRSPTRRNPARYRYLRDHSNNDNNKNMARAPLRINPRGPLVRFALYLDTLIAFILSCRAVTSCAFLSAEHEFYGDLVPGLFRTNNGNKDAACVHLNYNGELELPPSFKAARTFAIMATLVGFATLLLFTLVSATERFNTHFFYKRLLPYLMCVASAFQLFTFSAFGLDNCHTFVQNGITFHGKCIFAQGANCSMAAFLLYFLPVLPMMLYLPTPPHPLMVFSENTTGTATASHQPSSEGGGTMRCLSKSDKALQKDVDVTKGGLVVDPPTSSSRKPAVDLELPDQFDIVEIDDDMGEDVSALGNETISHMLHFGTTTNMKPPQDPDDALNLRPTSPPPTEQPADLLNTTGNTATNLSGSMLD